MKKFLCLVPLLVISFAFAQRKKESAVPEQSSQGGIQSKVAGMQSFPGFFEFFYDAKQDRILLVIDKFDSEFLYINSLPAGVGSNDIGLDRGQLGGNPNGGGYTGGGLGGGRSDFHLNGRSLIGRPQVTYDGTETGYVAINIKVDQKGNVTSATFSMKGSTISNPRLIEIAKKAASSGQLKYNANPDAPEEQFGVIRFFFKAE